MSDEWKGGKGDRNRVTNRDAYKANYDAIFGSDKKMKPGERIRITDGKSERVHDAQDFVSESCGIHPSQIEEATKLYGHMGVKWNKEGQAIFHNRQAKLKYLRSRGWISRND